MSTQCRCPSCGTTLTIEAASNRSGPAYPTRQNGSGGYQQPAQPWTPERARAFKMPFGKYRDRTMAQITLADPSYTEWLAENCDRNVQKAAQICLETMAEPAGAPRPSSAPSEAQDEFNEFE
jgi:hypothetical protein